MNQIKNINNVNKTSQRTLLQPSSSNNSTKKAIKSIHVIAAASLFPRCTPDLFFPPVRYSESARHRHFSRYTYMRAHRLIMKLARVYRERERQSGRVAGGSEMQPCPHLYINTQAPAGGGGALYTWHTRPTTRMMRVNLERPRCRMQPLIKLPAPESGAASVEGGLARCRARSTARAAPA